MSHRPLPKASTGWAAPEQFDGVGVPGCLVSESSHDERPPDARMPRVVRSTHPDRCAGCTHRNARCTWGSLRPRSHQRAAPVGLGRSDLAPVLLSTEAIRQLRAKRWGQ